MEKTSIIQAVFSDLGLTVVVQEASRRQMTLTAWCELGHCSKHPLSTTTESFVFYPAPMGDLEFARVLLALETKVMTSFLYCSLYHLADNDLSVILVFPFVPQVNSGTISRTMKQNDIIILFLKAGLPFSLLCKDDSQHLFISTHVYLVFVFPPLIMQ